MHLMTRSLACYYRVDLLSTTRHSVFHFIDYLFIYFIHGVCVSCTWRSGAGHCRAPIDCSMLSSLPLSCSAATSLPPPTHSSPMNTRGTYVQINTREAGMQLIHMQSSIFSVVHRVGRNDDQTIHICLL